MKVNENFPVRSIDVVLTDEERDRYNDITIEFINREVYIHSLRSGPEIGEDFKVVPNSFRIILMVEEEYADEFLMAIEGL